MCTDEFGLAVGSLAVPWMAHIVAAPNAVAP